MHGVRLTQILLHVVAAYTSEKEANGEFHEISEIDVELLEELIGTTFSKLYDTGLKNLTQLIRQGITKEMEDWIVREKMNVPYDDFIAKLCSLRKTFEQDTQNLVNILSISPENNDPEVLGSGDVKPQASMNSDYKPSGMKRKSQGAFRRDCE